MRITGFQAELHGEGYAVTIQMTVGREELADDWTVPWTDRLRLGLGELFEDTVATTKLATEPTTEPAPTGRRRRQVAEVSRETEKKDPDPTPAPPADSHGRRRRHAAPSAETKSPSDVSDADLVKAASLAAEKVGAKKVMELLEEFGVAKVQQLDGDLRGEFIEKAKALR